MTEIWSLKTFLMQEQVQIIGSKQTHAPNDTDRDIKFLAV